MSHIEQRRNLWYALLTVPVKARERVGKAKFVQSLGTPDKREAQRLAAPLIAKWQAIIRQAEGVPNAVAEEAERWKDALSQVTGEERETLEHVLIDHAEAIEAKEGTQEAQDYYGIATGRLTLSSTHYDEWKAQLSLAPRTIAQMVPDAKLFIAQFRTLQEVNKRSIKGWLDELSTTGSSLSTLERVLFSSRNYWKYLQTHEIVPAEPDPFFKVLAITKSVKSNGGGSWVPFELAEVVTLWAKAQELKDQPLADLIAIDAYTGARIEELCSLQVKDIKNDSFKIIDSKTNAGIREVPIHSDLKPVIKRLKESSKDGYLIPKLTTSKLGERSGAIGKRFGRLKTSLGFDGLHVFHSIRKTLVTSLERAGVSEGVTADIVGHEKKTMTYGLYSGGNSLETKRAALELVKYPFALELSCLGISPV